MQNCIFDETQAMAETVFFVGNGINTISSDASWETLLKKLHEKYYDDNDISFEEMKKQPFPLVYELIVLRQLKEFSKKGIESELKDLIADNTGNIRANSIHASISSGKATHIITPNYEFNLMRDKQAVHKNMGCVNEQVYSVFRHFTAHGKTYWHVHGDIGNPRTINLGYEHYCGQLQRMREYVTGVYNRGSESLAHLFDTKTPLVKRKYLENGPVYSWIDLFFRNNTTIKILGFRLEMEEMDIWWLLTYRAKIMYGAKEGLAAPVNNKIQYFIPKEFTVDKKGTTDPRYKIKKALMEGLGIEVIDKDLPHTAAFYEAVLGTE